MDKNKIIQVTNRENSTIGYLVPERGVRRIFNPRQTREVTFGELEDLSFLPGGDIILSEFLIIKDEEAIKELLPGVEPEYFYTSEEVKKLLLEGTIDEFLDCLDFAPNGVLELVKDLAVSLPVNDMRKREAILDKLNFNVTRAIEIKNTKFDGDSGEEVTEAKPVRRTTAAAASDKPERRASNYKVVEK